MKDTITGQPLGRGHVYLVPEEAAREAIAALHDASRLNRRSRTSARFWTAAVLSHRCR